MMKYPIDKIGYLIVLLVVTVAFNSFSQEVEHNYKVGPQVTTCDSLDISGSSPEKAIQDIKLSKFRYQQSFKLTRRQGFKGGYFYSCDGNSGFLILNYDDETFLYSDVGKNIWDELINSSDPEGYFLEHKSELHQFRKKE